MKDVLGLLNDLRRPRLLIRAARIGSEDYRRSAHLRRVLGLTGATVTEPRCGPTLMQLMELEGALNDQRQCGDAAYSICRHVDVLSAMMGEARLLRGA